MVKLIPRSFQQVACTLLNTWLDCQSNFELKTCFRKETDHGNDNR